MVKKRRRKVNHIIKKWMKKDGWTGQALAREVGVSDMQVSHWRTGRNQPRQATADKLKALGCPLPATKGETPLHAWILAQGWTIAQAAESFGVSRQTAYSWCYGLSSPQKDKRDRIKELTGISWQRSWVISQKAPSEIATYTPPKGGVLSGGDSEPIIALKSTPRDKRKQSAVERPSSGLTLEQMVKSLKRQRRR